MATGLLYSIFADRFQLVLPLFGQPRSRPDQAAATPLPIGFGHTNSFDPPKTDTDDESNYSFQSADPGHFKSTRPPWPNGDERFRSANDEVPTSETIAAAMTAGIPVIKKKGTIPAIGPFWTVLGG
jgi:hypothetical protein